MAPSIHRPSDALSVEPPVVLLVGQGGIGKTSLANSLDHPLLLNFDGDGVIRAAHRRDHVTLSSWSDAEDVASPEYLGKYSEVVVDTAERCIKLAGRSVTAQDPRYGSGDQLSPMGWGLVRKRVAWFLEQLRFPEGRGREGKVLVVLAHAKEFRDGEARRVAPDIPGGTLGELMKIASFVGLVSMRGNRRVLDFSPSDRFAGKNPGAWAAVDLPPVDRSATFLAELVDQARAVLLANARRSGEVAVDVSLWRQNIERYRTVADFNAGLEQLRPLQSDPSKSALFHQAASIMKRAAQTGGFRYDVDLARYVEAATLRAVAGGRP